MDDDPMAALFREMGDAIGITQAIALGTQFILLEVVREIAKTQPDPHAYLAGLFEKVSARLDQRPIEEESRLSAMEMRRSISTFFSKAAPRA